MGSKPLCTGFGKFGAEGKPTKFVEDDDIKLVSIDVSASVVHAAAEVEVKHIYLSHANVGFEGIYLFPLKSNAAMTDFQVEIDGKFHTAAIEPTQNVPNGFVKTAEKTNNQALNRNTKENWFQIRIGTLKPKSKVTIAISYVEEIRFDPETSGFQFFIPAMVHHSSWSFVKDFSSQSPLAFSSVPVTIEVHVCLQGSLRTIHSPSHTETVVKLETFPGNLLWQQAKVNLVSILKDMTEDFVLNILPKELHKARLFSEKLEDGSTALMFQMVPKFNLEEQKCELVFVLDLWNQYAKNALVLFLHSLPVDCYFNVVGYGSTSGFTFATSVKYNDANLEKAAFPVHEIKSGRKDKDLVEALLEIYSDPLVPGYLRQIVILFKNNANITDTLIGVVHANAHKARVFPLFDGNNETPHYLVETLAQAGGCTAEVATSTESTDFKLIKLLKAALQPALTDIKFEWKGLESFSLFDKVKPTPKEENLFARISRTLADVFNVTKDKKCSETKKQNFNLGTVEYQQWPKLIPSIYQGFQLLVLGIFKDKIPSGVSLEAVSPEGSLTVIINNLPQNYVESNGILHRLAAAKTIQELEFEVAAALHQEIPGGKNREQKLKELIKEIAGEYGLASKCTPFVFDGMSTEKYSENFCALENRHAPKFCMHNTSGLIQSNCHEQSTSTDTYDEGLGSIVLKLICLQSYNGSYSLNGDLCSILGKSKRDLQLVASSNRLKEPVVATALAISFFKLELQGTKHVCELVVNKAEQWIREQVSPKELEDAQQIAEILLRNLQEYS